MAIVKNQISTNDDGHSMLYRVGKTLTKTWGQPVFRLRALKELTISKIVIFGEIHPNRSVLKLQKQLLQKMIVRREGIVHLVTDLFNFEM